MWPTRSISGRSMTRKRSTVPGGCMRRFRNALLPVVLLLFVMIPGCSSHDRDSDETPGTTITPDETPGTTITPTSTGPTATSDRPTPGAPEISVTHEATPSDGGVVDISSPTRNIVCWMFEVGVRCDSLSRTWTAPPKPDDCQHDYAAMEIGENGPGYIGCTSDAIGWSDNILPYGEGIAYKGFECRSSQQGMYCRNLRTSHGFLLAAERYVLF